MEIVEVSSYEALPLLSLNHVSLLCRSVWDSMRFYEDVLGFVLIKRPSSFNFNGAWLAFYTLCVFFISFLGIDLTINLRTKRISQFFIMSVMYTQILLSLSLFIFNSMLLQYIVYNILILYTSFLIR
jgi:hypothetical protein